MIYCYPRELRPGDIVFGLLGYELGAYVLRVKNIKHAWVNVYFLDLEHAQFGEMFSAHDDTLIVSR